MGLHLTVGVIVILLAGWVSRSSWTRSRKVILPGSTKAGGLVQSYGNPAIVRAASVISWFGSVRFSPSASFAAALVFAWKRWFDAILGLALTMLGGSLLNMLLKQLFHAASCLRPTARGSDIVRFSERSHHGRDALLYVPCGRCRLRNEE